MFSRGGYSTKQVTLVLFLVPGLRMTKLTILNDLVMIFHLVITRMDLLEQSYCTLLPGYLCQISPLMADNRLLIQLIHLRNIPATCH